MGPDRSPSKCIDPHIVRGAHAVLLGAGRMLQSRSGWRRCPFDPGCRPACRRWRRIHRRCRRQWRLPRGGGRRGVRRRRFGGRLRSGAGRSRDRRPGDGGGRHRGTGARHRSGGEGASVRACEGAEPTARRRRRGWRGEGPRERERGVGNAPTFVASRIVDGLLSRGVSTHALLGLVISFLPLKRIHTPLHCYQ